MVQVGEMLQIQYKTHLLKQPACALTQNLSVHVRWVQDNILITSHFGCNELLPPLLEQAPPAQHLIRNHHQRHSESV